MDEANSQGDHAAGAYGAATSILREADVRRALTRIAHEIAERNASDPGLCLVGIHPRGGFLAGRLRDMLSALLDVAFPLWDLDIGLCRDRVPRRPRPPILQLSHSA